MSFDNYFMRVYESGYGDKVIEETEGVLGSEVAVEAFFALHAQVDLLVEECDIDVYSASYQTHERDDWTLARVLDAQDEKAALAKKGNNQAWMAIAAIAAAMRTMVVTAVIAPKTTFTSIQSVPVNDELMTDQASQEQVPGEGAVLKTKRDIQELAAAVDQASHPLEVVREAIDVTARMQKALGLGVDLPAEETELLPEDLREAP